jgi:hypothetical protein
MGDPLRDLIREAQAAEIRGDRERAAELLRLAASSYRDRGNLARADQLLRHAERLMENSKPVPPPPALPPPVPVVIEVASVTPCPSIGARCSFCCRAGEAEERWAKGLTGSAICPECAQAAFVVTAPPQGSA